MLAWFERAARRWSVTLIPEHLHMLLVTTRLRKSACAGSKHTRPAGGLQNALLELPDKPLQDVAAGATLSGSCSKGSGRTLRAGHQPVEMW